MCIGVAVRHDDASVVDDVVDAIDRAEGMHVVPASASAPAQVVLAGGRHLRGTEASILVVLSTGDATHDVRAGLEAGARGWLRWPEDMPDLGRVIGRAASEFHRSEAEQGRVVAVTGSRGGAGASTIVCLVAASREDALIVDLTGGQRTWAPESVGPGSLARALASPLTDVIEKAVEPHAAGRAIYGDGSLADAEGIDVFFDAARSIAPWVIVDCRRSGRWADRTILVCADDLGSLRNARDSTADTAVVLNRLRGRAIKPAHVRRVLQRSPVGVLRRTRSIARAADLGVLPSMRIRRRVAGWLS